MKSSKSHPREKFSMKNYSVGIACITMLKVNAFMWKCLSCPSLPACPMALMEPAFLKSLLIRGFFSDNSTFFERKLPLPPIILVNEIFFWSLLIVCVLLFLLWASLELTHGPLYIFTQLSGAACQGGSQAAICLMLDEILSTRSRWQPDCCLPSHPQRD